MNLWLTLIAAGLATFAIRLSFILLLERLALPSRLYQALRFVPPAVLTAIIVPELILPGGQLDLAPTNPRLLAGLIAMAVAWRTKNIALTIAGGMGALLLMQAVLR